MKALSAVIQTKFKNFQIKFPVSRKTGTGLKFFDFSLISTELSDDKLCNSSFRLKKTQIFQTEAISASHIWHFLGRIFFI